MQPNLSLFIENHLNEHSNKKSLFFLKNHQICSLTNHELLEICQSLKLLLQNAGLKPRQRVVIFGENSADWIIAYIAILFAGGIAVPLDFEILPEDIHPLIQWIDPCLILASKIQAEKCIKNIPCLILDDLMNKKELDIKIPDTSSNLDHIITMVQSSGTGGENKSIQLTQQNLMDVILTYQKKLLVNYSTGYILNLLPLSAIYPCVICLTCLCSGVPLLIVNPKNENVFEILSKEKIYCLPAVPLLLELIHKNIFDSIKQQSISKRAIFWSLFFLSKLSRRVGLNLGKKIFKKIHSHLNVELFATGGAPLAVEITRDLYSLGFTIQEGYGLTETCGLVSHTDGAYNNIGTVGKVVDGIKIKIDAPDEKGYGEILIKGRLMAGYFRNTEATHHTICDGWLHTGDIGSFDARGNLTIVGRTKDIIVHGDERKTIPEEIERHYKDIEGIKNIAVVGIPERLGSYHKVHAAVTLDNKFLQKFNNDQARSFQKIKEFIYTKSDQLPSHLQISFVHLVPMIPVNNLGKTKRAKLKNFLMKEIQNPTNTQ